MTTPNKVVLSDFATRVLPNLSIKQQQQQPAVTEPPLDPCDFGYRTVAPVVTTTMSMMEKPPLYTSTMVVSQQPLDDDCHTTTTASTLGQIMNDNEQEFMAAQREWDSMLDTELTRPHFEYYKEDPYHQFEDSFVQAKSLFAYVENSTDDLVEEAA